MKNVWRKLRTPRGIALAITLLLVLAGLGMIAGASPSAGLVGGLLMGLPLLGAALAADRETQQKEAGVKWYPVAAVKVYKGSLVCINASGYAAPAADTASFRVVGVAREFKDNSAGAAGDLKIQVASGRLFRFAASSITQAMVGQMMYVVDDQTFDDAIGTNAVKAGQLAEFISATEGWIFIPDGGVGNSVSAANAGGTYTAAEQTLINEIKARLNTYLHLWPILLIGGGLLAAGGWGGLLTVLPFLALGAVVSTDTLAAIRTDFQALFLESYAGYQARWQDITTEFPSGSQFLDLSWLGAPPAMKEWLDARVLDALRRHRYQIENKDWEATIEVDRNAIEDDNLGLYKPRVQELGIEAKRHLDEIVSDLLKNGTTDKAFDNVAFFADTRSIGDSGNIDNLLAGTGTTQAQFAADFQAARAALLKFKNDRGKPANPVLKLVTVVPPDLQRVAEETFNAGIIANNDNVLKGASDHWVNPNLADANDFYVVNTFGPIKPLAVSMRKRPGFDALDDPRSEHVFKNRTFLYGTDGRYNGGYLLPWKAVKTVNT